MLRCARANAGTIVRGSPELDHVHVQRRRGAGALVELAARARSHLAGAHRPQRVEPRLQALPRAAFLVGNRRHSGPQLLAHAAVRSRLHLSEHRREDVGGVEHRPAVHARVEIALAGAHADRGLGEPAGGDRDRGCALVGHQGVEHDRAVDVEFRVAQPAEHRAAADLLLPLDEEAHVHGELAGRGQPAGHVEQRQEVALVVGGAARVDASVALGRLEGRRQPGLRRAGILNVVVPVREHRWRVGPGGTELAQRHGVAAVEGHRLGAAAGRLDPIDHPRARLLERGGVAAARGHRGNAQPVVQIVNQFGHGGDSAGPPSPARASTAGQSSRRPSTVRTRCPERTR